MTKYIVKNCPAIKPMITVDGKHGGKTMFDVCSEGKYTPCQDRADCPIKQVVEMCKKEIDNCHCCKDRQTLHKQEISCGDCIHLGRRGLSKQILQTLQVEEVE